MRIEYIGHACFYFVTDDQTRIIIDPYDNSIGLTPISKEADIAVVTHHHHDHCCLDAVHSDYELVDGPGTYEIDGVRITGIEVPHDHHEGAHRGTCTAYLIEADNTTVLHMGDVGCVPPDSFFDSLPAKPDVLMVPVGGMYTVDADEALEICERIDPSAVLPMHYKTRRLLLGIAPINGFLEKARSSYDIQRQGDVLEVPKGIHKKRGRVIVMENSY